MNDDPPSNGWEMSKENVMPIKQGRSVTALNNALQLGTPQRNQELEETRKYNTYSQNLTCKEKGAGDRGLCGK